MRLTLRPSRRPRPAAVLAAVATALCGAALVAPPAWAEPKDPDEIWPAQVGAAALAALPCQPAGPAQRDAANADTLNPRLANKMRGHMNAYNASCARAVVDAVRSRGLNERAAAIAIDVTIVESSIANLDGGDADSVGLFQQRASWGSFAERTNPVIATNKFLDVMQSFYPNGTWNTAPIGDVAADVQRPAAEFEYRYAVEANDAVIIANLLWHQSRIGHDEVGIWRSFEAKFHLRDAAGNPFYVDWGGWGDVPVTGDWNGDGKTEVGIYRQTEGRFHLRDHAGNVFYVDWGGWGDLPVTGDWNGDGSTEVGIWRPSEGRFHLRDHTGNVIHVGWGGGGDIPVTGDWNGDGPTEVGIWRPSDGQFHLRDHAGNLFHVGWGTGGDIPIIGDWDGA